LCLESIGGGAGKRHLLGQDYQLMKAFSARAS
jgi:hypothetical protein